MVDFKAKDARKKALEYYVDMIRSAALEGGYSVVLYDSLIPPSHIKELKLLGYSVNQYQKMFRDGFFKRTHVLVTSIRWEV